MRGLRLIVAVAAFATSGCSTLPHADTVHTLTRPAATPDTAATVIQNYNEVSLIADRRRSAELIAEVQTGDLLRQTEAAYKISRFMKKPVARTTPFVVGSVGVPEYGGYPMRFVASGNHRLGLWERAAAGAPWRLACTVPSSIAVPDVDGLREVAPTSAAGPAESPSVAAAKLAEFLTVGAKSPYARSFTVAPEVAALQKDIAASQAMAGHDQIVAITNTFTVNAPPAAFRTAAGEVLAFFTFTNAHEMRTQFGAMWPVGQDTATFSEPNHLFRTALTVTRIYQFAIAIPAGKGAKIRVLGFTTQMVDSGGY